MPVSHRLTILVACLCALTVVSASPALHVAGVSIEAIYVNGGSKTGINVGDTLVVRCRDGAAAILAVSHTSSFSAACTIVSGCRIGIREGDVVATRTPVTSDDDTPETLRRFTDVHRGQFKQGETTARCQDCHNQNAFTPSTFTVERHEKTRLPLSGAHLALPCVSCHIETSDERGPYRIFVMDDVRCEACHTDGSLQME